MRVYRTFYEAINEMGRDLAEMGLDLGDNACQSELMNYGYMVTEPELVKGESNEIDFFNVEGVEIKPQILRVIRDLREDPASRRHYISTWDPHKGAVSGQGLPNTVGYHIVERDGRIHFTHHMRSCEFGASLKSAIEHAIGIFEHICSETQKARGRYTQFINSLYVYKKDLEGVF